MREVTERRQQLEQEHEQALAILTFKQNEVKRLQRAQFAAKKEQEGVVQMLEATVLELEEKCRSQSQQFSLLSHELERFRLQTGDVPDAEFYQLINGVREPEFTSHVSRPVRPSWPPAHQRRVLPPISSKPGPTAAYRHLPPTPGPLPLHTHKSPTSCQVVAAREGGTAAGKPKVFIVRHSYDPYNGPNHSPEVELPLRAGEYICVYGDIDEDGFYEGELMDGRRGLVPSNFVELVSIEDITGLPQSSVSDFSYNRLQLHPESLERSDPPRPEEGVPGRTQGLMTNGFDTDAEELAVDSVPYPRRLSLIKQLAKSIIIGWDPPLVPAGWGNVWSYNVFVDEELRLNVPFGAQTKAVLERMDVNLKAYRVSLQSVTERGSSDSLRCTFLVGRDVCMAPTQLRAEHVAATSAHLTWLPSNSSYTHTVSLNDGERWLVKPGGYSLLLSDLRPRQLYRATVEARSHCTPWELSLYGRQHRSAAVTFSTLASGLPSPPLEVQLEAGPSPGIALVSWMPVAADAAGTSNGVPVTGYTIYADKKKVLEVSSPTAGSALMGPAQIQTLQTARELTVRTMSPQGESPDSVPVPVLPNLTAITAGETLARPGRATVPAISPPLDLSAAKMSTLLHSPAADAQAPLRGVPSSAYKARSTDRASALSPQVGLASSSIAVQTLEAATGLGMRVPTISVSEFLEHIDSGAEPHPPTGPAPLSPQEVGPKSNPQDPADTHPQIPICPQLSPLEPGTEDGSSRRSTWARSADESAGQPELTPREPRPLKTPQETQHGRCLSRAGVSSDMSNLLEKDEGLCSDMLGEESHESTREDDKTEPWETDSDEEVLARILRAQVPVTKELSSIPEVTEEEDSCQETDERERWKSPQISPRHQVPEQDKPAATSSPVPCPTIPKSYTYCSTISNSPTHCSTVSNSPTHCSTIPNSPAPCFTILNSPAPCSTILNSPAPCSTILNSPAPCSTILNSPAHCSTIANSPTHRPKSPNDPIYRLPILDSTAHCSTMASNPTHQSKTSDDPIYHSSIPVKSAHCSTKVNSPTHQSKSPDSPVYHSTILDDLTHSPAHRSKVSFSSSYSIIPDGPTQHSAPMTQEINICAPASDSHFNTKHKCSEDPNPHQHVTRDPSRGSPHEAHDLSGYMTIPQPKSKPRHRVHYSDVVDTITYQREEYDSDSSVYVSGKEARRPRQRGHKPPHQRGHPESRGDPLRREALLRSQRASAKLPLGHYLGGKTVVRTRAPVTSGLEIDVEYGTEDDEGLPYDPAGVVVEQMSSEWWVEGGSPNVFEALQPKIQPRALPFKTEAANLPPSHSSRGVGPGTEGRGQTGVGDLGVCRLDYLTPSPRAKIYWKERSYSTDRGSTREILSHRGPQLTSKPGKTARAEARQLKDGVRLASPERVDPEGPACEGQARLFVALFSYDPALMSPNPDTAEEELPFKEGQIIKVYGDKDQDGFYSGESAGCFGYVPGNMVSEIQVEDEMARAQLLQKGFLSPEPSVDDKDPSKLANQPQEPLPRRMVAIFDYDPLESSPNTDTEAELCFSAGDVIDVFGDMDEDGFFHGHLNGREGLVPSNFLQALPLPEAQAMGGLERPQHQPEMPKLKPHPQRQRRKSVFAFNP
ncbi:RIMS-binding protein 2-like isoform X2 [Anguilla anguilla]|uniref:RIMS-binding protein 2-like isoform X2 n=1 Tax=Anguilla anguilla TaxID=7936 RepID=UPI0015AE146A|nr:RIMS-binding protein 2-like isoform X2 [Anguilla anguilla]